jgi:hypothetical protein
LAKPNEEVWASMLSEDQAKWIVNAKLEGKLITGKCKRARNINQKGATAL